MGNAGINFRIGVKSAESKFASGVWSARNCPAWQNITKLVDFSVRRGGTYFDPYIYYSQRTTSPSDFTDSIPAVSVQTLQTTSNHCFQIVRSHYNNSSRTSLTNVTAKIQAYIYVNKDWSVRDTNPVFYPSNGLGENSSITTAACTLFSTDTDGSKIYLVKFEWANATIPNGELDTPIYIVDIGVYVEKTAYTVTFNANGGSGSMSPQTFTRGVAATLTANAFTYTGLTFAYWNTAADGSGTTYTNQQSATFSADTTLYAQWAAANNIVTFNSTGGSNPSPTYKSVTYGSTYGTLPTVSRSGFSFVGWFTDSGVQVTAATVVSAVAPHVLYARWSAPTMTVNFNANGGTVAEQSRTLSYGEPYGFLPDATRSGHTFLGWYTAATGGTRVTAADIPATTPVTLYAHWSGGAVLWWQVTFS